MFLGDLCILQGAQSIGNSMEFAVVDPMHTNRKSQMETSSSRRGKRKQIPSQKVALSSVQVFTLPDLRIKTSSFLPDMMFYTRFAGWMLPSNFLLALLITIGDQNAGCIVYGHTQLQINHWQPQSGCSNVSGSVFIPMHVSTSITLWHLPHAPSHVSLWGMSCMPQ